MKTSQLQGAALDWAVALAEGMTEYEAPGLFIYAPDWAPSTSWSQGGPIIERELIDLYHVESAGPVWEAEIQMAPCQRAKGKGATALIAAMRCYVASKLGDDVVIPEELR